MTAATGKSLSRRSDQRHLVALLQLSAFRPPRSGSTACTRRRHGPGPDCLNAPSSRLLTGGGADSRRGSNLPVKLKYFALLAGSWVPAGWLLASRRRGATEGPQSRRCSGSGGSGSGTSVQPVQETGQLSGAAMSSPAGSPMATPTILTKPLVPASVPWSAPAHVRWHALWHGGAVREYWCQ